MFTSGFFRANFQLNVSVKHLTNNTDLQSQTLSDNLTRKIVNLKLECKYDLAGCHSGCHNTVGPDAVGVCSQITVFLLTPARFSVVGRIAGAASLVESGEVLSRLPPFSSKD